MASHLFSRPLTIFTAGIILLVLLGANVILLQAAGLMDAGWQFDFHIDRNPIHGCHHWARLTIARPPDWLKPDVTLDDIRLDWDRKLGAGVRFEGPGSSLRVVGDVDIGLGRCAT